MPLNEFLFLSVADESAVRINIGINMKSNLASTMRGKAIYYCERHVNGIPESASTKLSIRFTLACGGGSSMGGSTFEPLVPASWPKVEKQLLIYMALQQCYINVLYTSKLTWLDWWGGCVCH